MKSSNSIGCGKELCVTTSNWTVNGISYTSYGYTYSDEKFDRPIKTAYKITLHDKSYRDEKGRVRKKQYHVTTIKYYDLVDFGWYDCIISETINEIAGEMGIEPELVWTEIEDKLDALQDKVRNEFSQTEEYSVKEKQDAILNEYKAKKHEFAEEYETQENEYDRCYDIFGILRNPEYLEKIKREYAAKKNMKREAVVTKEIIKVTTIIIPAVMGQVHLIADLAVKKRNCIIRSFIERLLLNSILIL